MAEIHKLRVKSPYKLMRILDIKIENKPNNHGYLYLKCYVDEMINIDPTVKSSTEDQIIIYEESENTSDDSEININEPDERNSKRLFNGLVQNIKTSNENGTYYLEIQALTVSSKLDIEKKSRSFQNVDITYKELINSILADYTGYGFTQYIGENKKTGKPLFQYKETDWEFLKRVASELKSELYCDIINSDLAFNFGIPKDHNHTLDDNTYYSAFKDLKAFEEAGGYNAGFNDTDYFYYEVDIRDIYEIGSIIEYKEKELYVREYEGYRNKEELFYKYTLCMKNGVWQKIIYNDLLKGATIEGQVIATQKEQVKLHLDIDKTQDEEKAYWFRYAPPSVNIMYSMPVTGDSARLYFPKESSEEPIVTGCARKNGTTYQGMSNPNNRYFHTEHGSEIAMLPGALQIKGGSKSLLSINFEDRRGIIITSPEGINLNSSEEILIKTPNKININAQSQILVIKGNTNHGVSIDGEVHIKGDRVITKTTNKEVFAGKIESIETKSQLLGANIDIGNMIDWKIAGYDINTGWVDKNGNRYYYFSDETMAKGWANIDGSWYYFYPGDGSMAWGRTILTDGSLYYVNDEGKWDASEGWKEEAETDGSTTYYYVGEDGLAVTGWKEIDGSWYYFDEDGKMQTGWKQENDDWYYFNDDGKMQTGTENIDGTDELFGSNGKWTPMYVTKDQLEEMFKEYGYFLSGKVDDNVCYHVNYTINKYIVDGCTDDATIKNRIRNFMAQGMYESRQTFIEEGSDDYIARHNYEGGINYRGTGFIQVTHKSAYQSFANDMNDQEIVNQGYKYVAENYPFEIGGYWWKSNTMNLLVDNGATMKQVGNAINKGRGAWHDPGEPDHEGDREQAYKVVNEII